MQAGFTDIDDIAGGHGLVQRAASGGFPDLHGKVEIAGLQPGKLGDVIGLNVFDIAIPGLFQDAAHDLGVDQLA